MKRYSPNCAESFGFFVVSRSLYSVAIPFFLLLVMTLHATPSVAQEATIVGTVADPSGSVVPNVIVTVTQTGSSPGCKSSTPGWKGPGTKPEDQRRRPICRPRP